MTIVDDLLPACTVRIDVRDTPAGTGFFVGRGLIVTCAHVVESPADPAKAISADDIRAVITPKGTNGATTQEQVIPVDVRSFAPLPSHDLAVLKVREAFDNPSVLLDSAPTLAQDELHTFAYPEKKKLGVPRLIRAEGNSGDGLVAFSQGQVQSGMSGAPLFNFRTGAVCGVISISRDRRQALGGYAIPIKRLLALYPKVRGANGSVHDRDSAWVRALSVEQRQRWQTSVAVESASHVRSLTVSLGQTIDGWRVVAEEPDGGTVPEEWVDLNAVRDEVARLFRDWASRGWDDGPSRGRVQESEQLRLLGGILFSAAFPGSIGERLRELSSREGDPVVVSLRFESGLNALVVELPWEHLCIPEAAERELYLATDEHFGLVRVMPLGPPASESPNLSEGLSVAVVAVPGGESAKESGAPSEVVGRITKLDEKFPSLEPHELDSPDIDQLNDLLADTRPIVLHYVGSGRFSHGRDEIALGPSAALQHAPVELLIDALPDPPPRLVILQMVGSPPPNVTPADFSVFAPPLIKHGVEAVLAYQFPVDKSATIRFNKELYTHLLAGHSLDLATQEARRAMSPYGTGRSFVSPAIFLANPGPLPLCLPTTAVEQGMTTTRSSSYATANV